MGRWDDPFRIPLNKITFYIPAVHKYKIYRIADENKCKVTDVFRIAVKEYLIRYDEMKKEKREKKNG